MGDKSKRALYDEKMADPGFRYRTEYRHRQGQQRGGAQQRGGRRSYAPRKHDASSAQDLKGLFLSMSVTVPGGGG